MGKLQNNNNKVTKKKKKKRCYSFNHKEDKQKCFTSCYYFLTDSNFIKLTFTSDKLNMAVL